MKKKQTVICYLFKKLTFNCPVFFQQFHVNSQTLSYRIIKVAYNRILFFFFFFYIERKPLKLRRITDGLNLYDVSREIKVLLSW